MSQNKKFKIVTLGCRTNQYESQAYADQLTQLGYSAASENEHAEVCIVNTCTVTASADNQSRHEVRQLAAQYPGSRLIVTGCAAEQHPDQMKAISGVESVVANKDKESLVSFLFPDLEVPEFAISHFQAHTRAFVKVQDGCNSFCTYCTIPYVRGRSRSRPVADILREVKELIANGFREVVITGINVGDFDGGKEPGDTLADLIRAVDKIEGLDRLRLSSIDPDEVDDNLLDAIINGKKTCHSMHIVLQSGSNVILKRMNRKYTRQIFMDTADKLRNASPDFTFTTDVIVGFPGETDADFAETMAVIKEVEFAKIHMFPFSARPRTRAALMPNKVPQEIIKERKQQVLHLAEQTAYRLQERYVGRKMIVLTEGSEGGNQPFIHGHTDNFLKVSMQQDNWKANQLLEVELTENTPTGLNGRVIRSCDA